jgi:hypothetical protein
MKKRQSSTGNSVCQYPFTNGPEELHKLSTYILKKGHHVLKPMTWLEFSMIIDALAQ